MRSTRKTYSDVVVLAILAIVSCVSPIPIPGTNPLLHSLATYATTNSFLYTPRFGTENYLVSKPQIPTFKTHTNFIGFPQHQSFDLSTRHFSASPILQSKNINVIPLGGKTATTGDIKLLSSDINISPFLTPPRFPFSPQAGGSQLNDENFPNESTAPKLERSTITPLKHMDISSEYYENGKDGDLEEDIGSPSGSANEFPSPNDSSTENKGISYSPISSNVASQEDESNQAHSRSELEDLFNKVINAPVRKTSLKPSNPDTMSILNRQDSSLEQPLPFFSSGTQKLSPQGILNKSRPQFQFPPLGTSNYRFTLPSTTHQQPLGAFPGGINRFPFQNTQSSQGPPVQPIQNQPQHPQSPVSQIPSDYFSMINNNNLPRPSIPNSLTQPQLNFPASPTQPQSPFPQNNGPPSQEPENGYNPFHLQENFPEPPFESEFANDPPLDNEELAEQRQRSAGENIHPPPAFDFAQSTLRNVRTEELLDVVKRKQIPAECVYNTISYGPNGEDCLEARKK